MPTQHIVVLTVNGGNVDDPMEFSADFTPNRSQIVAMGALWTVKIDEPNIVTAFYAINKIVIT